MPANRFAPDRIVVGHSQDPAVIDRILQRLLGRWPITKCDIRSVFHAAVDYSDGSMVPSENINVDELLNNTTGVVRALGCLDLKVGMELLYTDGQNLKLTPGFIVHRSDFKQSAAATPADRATDIPAASLIHTADSVPTDGNASGLDDDLWYYVYANMSAAGGFPTIGELLRISILAPTDVEGFGLEHPNDQNLRFVDSIRTMATGEIRPYDRGDNGWTYWRTIAAADVYAAGGYGNDIGSVVDTTTTGWETYEDPNTTGGATNGAYHQGIRHIPESADFILVMGAGAGGGSDVTVRPIGDAGGGHQLSKDGATDNEQGSAMIAVNMPGLTAAQMQTFEIDVAAAPSYVDVIAYHERTQ